MEKRNHIEVCNLRESTSVLILEHIADWYALLIKARIILALTKHLCVLSLLDITGNFITVKVIIIEIILQGIRLHYIFSLVDERLTDLVELALG